MPVFMFLKKFYDENFTEFFFYEIYKKKFTILFGVPGIRPYAQTYLFGFPFQYVFLTCYIST